MAEIPQEVIEEFAAALESESGEYAEELERLLGGQINGGVDQFENRSQDYQHGLSPYEKRVDFAAVEKALDSDAVKTDLALRVPIRKVLDDLIALMRNQDKAGGITQSFVQSLTLTTGPEAQKILGDYLLGIWRRGRELATGELPDSFKSKIRKFAGLEPVQAINFFQNLRPWLIKGIIDDELKKTARLELTEHLKGGRTLTETIGNLRSAWEPWIGDPEKVIPSGISGTPEDILQAYRLENIIRTEVIGALSQGRAEIADEAGDFVVGFELSPVLDVDTHLPLSESRGSLPCNRIRDLIDMDRPVRFKKDDPRSVKLLPPLLYNCRTLEIFITTDDLPVRWSTEAELDSVLRLVPRDFK